MQDKICFDIKTMEVSKWFELHCNDAYQEVASEFDVCVNNNSCEI